MNTLQSNELTIVYLDDGVYYIGVASKGNPGIVYLAKWAHLIPDKMLSEGGKRVGWGVREKAEFCLELIRRGELQVAFFVSKGTGNIVAKVCVPHTFIPMEGERDDKYPRHGKVLNRIDELYDQSQHDPIDAPMLEKLAWEKEDRQAYDALVKAYAEMPGYYTVIKSELHSAMGKVVDRVMHRTYPHIYNPTNVKP